LQAFHGFSIGAVVEERLLPDNLPGMFQTQTTQIKFLVAAGIMYSHFGVLGLLAMLIALKAQKEKRKSHADHFFPFTFLLFPSRRLTSCR
jgi:hypothetical protein